MGEGGTGPPWLRCRRLYRAKKKTVSGLHGRRAEIRFSKFRVRPSRDTPYILLRLDSSHRRSLLLYFTTCICRPRFVLSGSRNTLRDVIQRNTVACGGRVCGKAEKREVLTGVAYEHDLAAQRFSSRVQWNEKRFRFPASDARPLPRGKLRVPALFGKMTEILSDCFVLRELRPNARAWRSRI